MNLKRSLEAPLPQINWEDRILCQTITDQPLITPTTDGHESLAKDLRIFAEYESLPRCIKSLKGLDEGNGVQQTLVKHNAKYYKLCRSKCDRYKAQQMVANKSDRKTGGRLLINFNKCTAKSIFLITRKPEEQVHFLRLKRRI